MTESAGQRHRHSDISLDEEEMNAKTKAWLLMVESGKVDEEELRKITPKSIFIAPLLTNGAAKCKEGYRYDHLGQCVKVIKIDPKVQLELLLQRLNKLYAEKTNEEEKEDKEEVFHASSGPLQFSLPISGADDKHEASQQETKVGGKDSDSEGDKSLPEFIPIPLPFVLLNQTNQTKEIESSGWEPLNEEPETSQLEGSGTEASGDDAFNEETTTESPVSLISDEPDYLDEKETTAAAEDLTTEPPEVLTTAVPEENSTESYQSAVDSSSESSPVVGSSTEAPVKPNPDRIVFPTDDIIRSPIIATAQSSRIRFPDEAQQPKIPSYQQEPDQTPQIHSGAIPPEQFWWLPKNWQVDGNHHKSALVKVWSRLPLIHDITYSQGPPRGFEPSYPSERPRPSDLPGYPFGDDAFSISNLHHRSPDRSLKHYKTNRFHDILQRQNLRIHR